MTEQNSTDIAAKISSYEALALEWMTAQSNDKKANKVFFELQRRALELRGSEAGRSGLVGLLHHPVRGVRMKSAEECLAFAPRPAEEALEALINPEGDLVLGGTMSEPAGAVA
jgi:hypothetical protein